MDWWSLVDLSAYAVHLHEDNVKVEVNCSLLGGWIYFPTIETSARTVASLARTHARARRHELQSLKSCAGLLLISSRPD